ncbi:hypothetical protein JJB75_13920 [Clostridium perfringens]|uniref:hypothetical protein n=1 Tax=Clostridium perfringens TaxID=1502 RepID=UPI000BBF7186|nr:hypothetical protein [Clostridium perfringens]ASY52790.1 hypothetical protein BG908_14470 [Clostridium perfringens]AWS24375.1 hypothetical protein CYK96_01605 [Clostridium perfringens]MBO3304267.1 hypothetical protein [Clostridium perfringens]MBO3307587.1 hypothetical protein [Clostridium perfringens]MBO3309873.1 hypothetical protein [Clostridium perfringens]
MERKELVNQIEVNFYDFGEFEYYALVLAENQENAIKGYTEVVSDIEDEELVPRIITRKEALEKYKKGEIEGCETVQEKVQDFYKEVSEFRNPLTNGGYEYLVLLIDSSLL